MSLSVRLVLLAAIGVLYFGFPNARPDFVMFNSDDGESYLALSYALTHGLGYTRSLIADEYVPLTVWAPGMAVLLAPVAAFVRIPIDWLPVKLYMITLGLLGIALVWGYVRRMTGDRMAADMAALIFAMAPFYWLYSRITMSEVPSIIYMVGILWLVDVIWRARQPPLWQAGLVGLLAGGAMMVRGNTIGLVLVPLAYCLPSYSRAPTFSRRLLPWFVYSAGFIIPYGGWILRNRALSVKPTGFDGVSQVGVLLAVDPVDPASPWRTIPQLMHGFYDNLTQRFIYRIPEQILPGLWNADWQHWPGAAIIALTLSGLFLLLAAPRDRRALPVLLAIAPHAAMMAIYTLGGSERFWLPISSLVIIVLIIQWQRIWRDWTIGARNALGVLVLLSMGGNLLIFALRHERAPHAGDLGDLAALYEKARALPTSPGPTLTEHAIVYSLSSGWPAPLNVPDRANLPRYRAMTVNDQGSPLAYRRQAPPGSVELARAGAWRLMALPETMTATEVFTRSAK